MYHNKADIMSVLILSCMKPLLWQLPKSASTFTRGTCSLLKSKQNVLMPSIATSMVLIAGDLYR